MLHREEKYQNFILKNLSIEIQGPVVIQCTKVDVCNSEPLLETFAKQCL